jgi:hypothetical protein
MALKKKKSYKVRLDSDFFEDYDVWFNADEDAPVFRRSSADKLSKLEQFKFLLSLGYKVPRHGSVSELAEIALEAETPEDMVTDVVVYLDSTEADVDKVMLPIDEAFVEHPDKFASDYIEGDMGAGIAYKLLQIGKRQFALKFSSVDEWRSNSGEFVANVLMESPTHAYLDAIRYPLWSIDYIATDQGPIAIDFDIAPKLTGIDFLEFISDEEIAEEIQEALAYFSAKSD